jgi:hypothetical protein
MFCFCVRHVCRRGNKRRNIKGFNSNLVAQIGYIKVSKPALLRGTFIVKGAKEVVDNV